MRVCTDASFEITWYEESSIKFHFLYWSTDVPCSAGSLLSIFTSFIPNLVQKNGARPFFAGRIKVRQWRSKEAGWSSETLDSSGTSRSITGLRAYLALAERKKADRSQGCWVPTDLIGGAMLCCHLPVSGGYFSQSRKDDNQQDQD